MEFTGGFSWGPWGDLAVLGVDFICASLLYSVYRRKERLIKNILDAPNISVGPDLQEVLQGSSNGGEGLPYAVIRGRVGPTSPTSVITSSSGLNTVMQRVTLNEHSYRRSALNHWGDNVKTIHQANNSVPFVLRSMSDKSNGFEITIPNGFDADEESLFLTTATNFTPSNSSVASTVMGFFTGVAVRGVERTEEVLPVDTVITGIGKLIKDKHGFGLGSYKLVPPADEDQYRFILSTLPLESIVKRLENRSRILRITLFVLLSVGAVISIRRLRQLWKDFQLKKMREEILKQRSKIDTEGLSDIQICTVCLSNPREVILLNCGHVCVCADCCLKINGKCPVCRSTVVSTHPAFIV